MDKLMIMMMIPDPRNEYWVYCMGFSTWSYKLPSR